MMTGQVSYILVLAVLSIPKQGSLALHRPLSLDTLPEEMARFWRVREGFVCVDLAGESLIQGRHFDSLSKKKQKKRRTWRVSVLNQYMQQKKKRVQVTGGQRGMAEVIRLDDVLVQFRKKSLQAVFRIHCTYFQAQWSGLTDAAATRFPDFSNLMQKQASANYRRPNKAIMIRTRKTGKQASAISRLLHFPPSR